MSSLSELVITETKLSQIKKEREREREREGSKVRHHHHLQFKILHQIFWSDTDDVHARGRVPRAPSDVLHGIYKIEYFDILTFLHS